MRLKEENKNKPWIDEPIYKHEYKIKNRDVDMNFNFTC